MRCVPGHAGLGVCVATIQTAVLRAGRGEFLRALHTRQGAQGYICRAIAAMVTQQLQGTGVRDVPSAIEGVFTSIQTLFRRGGDEPALHSMLLSTVKGRTANISRVEKDYVVPSHLKYPWPTLTLAYASGGIDLGRPGSSAPPEQLSQWPLDPPPAPPWGFYVPMFFLM